MNLILNIETTTDICSVCLSNGPEVLSVKEDSRAHIHTSIITVLIEQCLSEAGFRLKDLCAVAVSKGPGSYTGLRVGVSTAKGICYALGIPLLGIDTLQALALGSKHPDDGKNVWYCPMIDARRMEVYTAVYNADLIAVVQTESKILQPASYESFTAEGHRLICSGNGAPKFKGIVANPDIEFRPVFCSSRFLAPLAGDAYSKKQFVDLAYFVPDYLKPPNITIPKKVL